jgi:menaquinone-dependent protoporphyrinogen IX oxidase
MRILITWGSRRGGTAGLGRILGEALTALGHEVVATPAEQVRGLTGFDAVIIGGALYANRWRASARRFVGRHIKELREALPTAAAWTALAALPDLALAAVAVHDATVKGIVWTCLPLALVFLGIWAVGAIMATLPWPKPAGDGADSLAAAR